MAHEPADVVLSREVKRALSEAGLSAPAAARKLGWDRKRIYRWMDGDVSPRLEDIEAFAVAVGPLRLEVGGKPKNAPAGAGAAEELLRLWKGPEAPPWAHSLSDAILSAIEVNHQALVDRTAAQYAELIDTLLGPGSGGAGPPQSKGPPPKPRGPKQGPRPPSAPQG